MKKITLIACAAAVSASMWGCFDASTEASVPSSAEQGIYSSSETAEPLPVVESSSSIYVFDGISSSARSSSSKAVSSSSAYVSTNERVSTRMQWSGYDDEYSTGKVETGSDEETAGYWYTYNDNDAPNNGNSVITFPTDVKEDDNGSIFGPLIEKYRGIKATINIGTDYEYAFAGFAFNIWSEKQEGVDISQWNGVCLGYSSTAGFAVELAVEDEATVTEYNNYKATVAKSVMTTISCIPWTKFKQESGWGVKVAQDSVLTHTAAIRIKFTASGDFFLNQLADPRSFNYPCAF